MNYRFPTIRHIDDVLPHIEGDNSFVVARKDGYTAIDYVVVTSDSFRPLTGDSENDLRSMVRRECRGLIFCNDTGNLLRRPFHKFFNIGEREETINLDFSKGVTILTKLDGSMIAPFIMADGVVRWGTKLGETEVAKPVIDFVNSNSDYHYLAKHLIELGYTPIFEWMSRDNRIVIDYGDKPQLILTAIRTISTGMYWDRGEIRDLLQSYPGVVFVNTKHVADITSNDFANFANETDCEGYVIMFENGHMVKFKNDWYTALHKAKDAILREHNVATLVLDGKVDDILPHLLQTDADRLRTYQDQLVKWMTTAFIDYRDRSFQLIVTDKIPVKDFALYHAKSFGPFSAIIYKMIRDVNVHEPNSWNHRFVEGCRELILKNAKTLSGWTEFKKANGLKLEWNEL